MSLIRFDSHVITADTLSDLHDILLNQYSFNADIVINGCAGYAKSIYPFDQEIDTETQGFILEGYLELGYLGSQDFDTDLYSELLNNEETVSNLNTYINGGDVSMITDKDLLFQKNIELYNANVLALRATKNVNAKISGDINTRGQTVDLSGINNTLLGINRNIHDIQYPLDSISSSLIMTGSDGYDKTLVNALDSIDEKLKRTETIDNQEVEKNITQTINDLNLSNQTVITTVEKAPYNPLLDDGSDIDF